MQKPKTRSPLLPMACDSRFKLYFNSGSRAVCARCGSLHAAECISRRSWPRLGRSEGRGAEIARRDRSHSARSEGRVASMAWRPRRRSQTPSTRRLISTPIACQLRLLDLLTQFRREVDDATVARHILRASIDDALRRALHVDRPVLVVIFRIRRLAVHVHLILVLAVKRDIEDLAVVPAHLVDVALAEARLDRACVWRRRFRVPRGVSLGSSPREEAAGGLFFDVEPLSGPDAVRMHSKSTKKPRSWT